MVVVVVVVRSVITFKIVSVVSAVSILILMSICISTGSKNIKFYLMSVDEVTVVSYAKTTWVTSGVTVAV